VAGESEEEEGGGGGGRGGDGRGWEVRVSLGIRVVKVMFSRLLIREDLSLPSGYTESMAFAIGIRREVEGGQLGVFIKPNCSCPSRDQSITPANMVMNVNDSDD
jgi:hypothetical protein